MTQKLILTCLIILLSNTSLASQIQKCQVNGKTVFQNTPCAEDFDYGLKMFDTFDSWNYGMNIIAFKKEAKSRKLPVMPGQNSFLSKYNDRIINGKPDARTYTYNSTVAGKHTRISLFFTPKTQRLYKVKARLYLSQLTAEEKRYFYNSLVQKLSNKYGSYIEAKDYPPNSNLLAKYILKGLVGTEKLWGSKTDNLVSLTGNKRSTFSYEMVYKYIPLIKQNIIETTKDIQKNTDKAIMRDAGKF